jgi:hypothetical protein
MEVIQRKRQRKTGEGIATCPRQCSMPGCIHSASFDVVLLGTEHVPLCSRCKAIWVETWEHALHGWPDREPVAA